jgi:carbon-monoxide dehydrogenase small subunit
MECYEQMIPLRFTLNGKEMDLEVAPGETALNAIRVRLGLKGTKEGCGIGECGACTIMVAGKAVNACLLLAAQLHEKEVLTVEGLNLPEGLSPLQKAFLDRHAVQCGFCTPGVLMSVHALFQENPQPSLDEAIKAVSGNLCRCTGYQQIVTAVEEAAIRLQREKSS